MSSCERGPVFPVAWGFAHLVCILTRWVGKLVPLLDAPHFRVLVPFKKVPSADPDAWAGMTWPVVEPFGDKERKQWESDGYVIVQNAIPLRAVRSLVRELRHQCSNWEPGHAGVSTCDKFDSWTHSNMMYEFLTRGPLGAIAASLLRVDGVRLATEAFMQKIGPKDLHRNHRDSDICVWHMFNGDSKGLQAYIPLVDVQADGSTIAVYPGTHHFEVNTELGGDGDEVRLPPRLPLTMRAGDLLLTHPLLIHASHAGGMGLEEERMAWQARFVEQHAVLGCAGEDLYGAPRYLCSPRPLVAGMMADSSCFPQVFPVLAREAEDRAAPTWGQRLKARWPHYGVDSRTGLRDVYECEPGVRCVNMTLDGGLFWHVTTSGAI